MDDQRTATMTMMGMIMGAHLARMISVAAELGVADLLEDGAQSCDTLAAATGTHAPSLYRLLRGLTNAGIFSEGDDEQIALTPLADRLRTRAAGSLRDTAIFVNDDWFWEVYRDLPYAVRTGKPATAHLWGKGLFEYFADHPDASRRFDNGMASIHADGITAVAEGYDFAGIETVIDVGGNDGSLLAAILAANPLMRGVLFDLPNVVANAAGRLAAWGIAERCEAVGGDFFERLPDGGDAYLLSNVLHDWDDDQATVILRNVRTALGGRGRLLIANEQIIPPRNTPDPGKLLDITMLLIGGRERTMPEWSDLLQRSGFSLTRVVPLPSHSGVGVIEAVPAA
jgi:hypothetical protein